MKTQIYLPTEFGPDSFLPGNDPLIVKMRRNPLQFIESCNDRQLVKAFPITKKALNINHRGSLSKYRKSLLKELRQGSLVIE